MNECMYVGENFMYCIYGMYFVMEFGVFFFGFLCLFDFGFMEKSVVVLR